MGLLERITGRFKTEKRDMSLASSLTGNYGRGERLVNARTAENLSTVLACVGAISSAIASLPAFVYRLEGDQRKEDPRHPLARLVLTGPNERQTWPDFIEWLMASTLLRGNGLAEIRFDGAGRVTGLVPVPWEYVSMQVLPTGRIAYDVTEQVGFYGATGRVRRLLEGEVLHLKDRSDDGIIGRSRLSRAAAVVANALTVQDCAGSVYENGTRLSGVLSLEGVMKKDVIERISDSFNKAYAGSQNSGKVAIVDNGAKFHAMTISPEDAELLESRRFTGEELARLFQVPPPIIGDLSHGTFTNSETLIRFFAQSTLSSWCRKIEAEVRRAVFSESARASHSFEIDLSGLLRGDPETRWKSHEIALRNRVLLPNEIRELEGWNPRTGGDQFDATPQPTEVVSP